MFAIVDLETTGGNPQSGRIIEIGVVIHNGHRVIEDYNTLVNPEEPLNPFITALTGISDSMLETAPTFNQIANEVLQLTQNRVFVAHNVRFDYGFMKQEFKRLNKPFQRRNLCTSNLSRKLLPGYTSYGLSNLCRELDIPIKNRHRALGDAAATAILFEKLLFNDKKRLIESMLKDELANANLPPHLNRKIVRLLPEETGVYYFLDQKGNCLYIGKSTNIKQRVLSHFSGDLSSSRFRKLKEQVHNITWEITGSNLLAELIESGEIKRFMPPFNKAQRRKKYRYGIFLQYDDEGFANLSVALLHPSRHAVLRFASKHWAEKALQSLNANYGLDEQFKQTLCIESYNKKVLKAVNQFHFKHNSFLIIDEGRTFVERVIIQVEDNRYKGYGYVQNDESIGSAEILLHNIKPDYDAPDKCAIIKKHLKNKKYLKILPLTPSPKIV